jgi:hypothetical protein
MSEIFNTKSVRAIWRSFSAFRTLSFTTYPSKTIVLRVGAGSSRPALSFRAQSDIPGASTGRLWSVRVHPQGLEGLWASSFYISLEHLANPEDNFHRRIQVRLRPFLTLLLSVTPVGAIPKTNFTTFGRNREARNHRPAELFRSSLPSFLFLFSRPARGHPHISMGRIVSPVEIVQSQSIQMRRIQKRDNEIFSFVSECFVDLSVHLLQVSTTRPAILPTIGTGPSYCLSPCKAQSFDVTDYCRA